LLLSGCFDQIRYLLEGIRQHSGSRRLVATTWNPPEMVKITKINKNPNTPSTCHGSLIQCHVRNGKLHMTQYQRSADVLLGVPHNWCQYWALLLYLAHWTRLEPGTLRWIFGDLHLYQDPTHVECAKQFLNLDPLPAPGQFALRYRPSVEWMGLIPEFKASDFVMDGEVPEPVIKIRPKLL
jgi:thymidylate synthase